MGSLAVPVVQQEEANAPCAQFDADVLARTPLFGGMTDECRCVLTDRMETRHYPAGATVYSEGEPARELFILASGHLTQTHNAHTMRELEPTDFFGVLSFLDMQPRAHTVRAKDECVVYAIPYTALRALYQNNVRAYALIVMNIAREVSRRLRQSDCLR